MKISILKKVSTEELRDIQELLNQLSGKPEGHSAIKLKTVEGMVSDAKTLLVVARNEAHIVGMGMIGVIQDFDGPAGHIDNVVVLDTYRGQGIGEEICKELIALARKKKLMEIDLTSRPSRIAANKLYQKLGFELRETNVYRMKLDS